MEWIVSKHCIDRNWKLVLQQLASDPGLPFEFIATAEAQDSKPENVTTAPDLEAVVVIANDTATVVVSQNDTVHGIDLNDTTVTAKDASSGASETGIAPIPVKLLASAENQKAANDEPFAKEEVKAFSEKQKFDQKQTSKESNVEKPLA